MTESRPTPLPSYPLPGELVRIRDVRWRVISCTPHGAAQGEAQGAAQGAAATLEVAGADARADSSGARATFLLPFEPWNRLAPGHCPQSVSAGRWRRLVRRVVADATPSWTSLRAAPRARLTLIPFQLEPVLALVRGQACRFLIADAVGLGKTIQAGLMIAETLLRVPGARALVVAPAGLRDQWREELAERFALEPQVLDAGSLARAQSQLPDGTNPWAVTRLAITSIDFVKRPDVVRALEGLIWDLVVFDEAHALGGRSDRAAAAGLLAGRGRAVVMLTATPHSGDDEAFGRLCALGDLAGGFPLMTFRRSRTVLGSPTGRHTRILRVRPTPDEQAMHDALHDYATAVASERHEIAGAHLAVSVLTRRASSSAASLAASLRRRISLLASLRDPLDGGLPSPQLTLPFGLADDDDAPGDELSAPALADRDEELTRLAHLCGLADVAARGESKVAALGRFLRRIDEPAMVFTEYRDTLGTLAAALGGEPALLHGGLSQRERREAAHRFTHGSARLLLATDAASEGLNLHHRCRLVIHLEVPWTPVRLEQRTGRVDRFGQQRTVHAVHLLAGGTAEEEIAARVARRARQASAALDSEDSSPDDSSRDSARLECARIEGVRLLDRNAAVDVPYRPVVTIVKTTARRRRPPSQLWGYHLPIVDADGLLVWTALRGIAATLQYTPRAGAIRLLRQSVACPAIVELAADAARLELSRLQSEARPALDAMVSREEAIDHAVRGQRARVSAALLQPGLFDRRREHSTSAQRRMLDEAVARVEARLASLAALRSLRTGNPRPVFGLGFA